VNNKKIYFPLAVLIVIVIFGTVMKFQKRDNSQLTAVPESKVDQSVFKKTLTEAAGSVQPKIENISTAVNDTSAETSTFNIAAGDLINLTVKVKTTGVYYGGLDLRSNVVSTNTILPGQSKTVSFLASKSFDIHAFWPSSEVEKTTVIHMVVH